MTTLTKILLGIVIGIAIVGWLLWGIQGCQNKKVVESLNSRIKACENAPTKTDTIIRYDTIIINKVRVLTQYHSDTVVVNGQIVVQKSYNDTLRTADFDLAYETKVIGALKEVNFPWYSLHTKEIFTVKTVDTCFNKPAITVYKPKNHIGIDVNLIGNNVKQMPNTDAVFFWSVKDKWKLNAGVEYNTYHNELYGKIGIGIYFK